MANNSTISTCKLWPNNPFKCNILFVVQHIFPSISILGCSWILLIIWLFKKYHVFVQRLIVALVTSALFLSVSYLLGNVHMKHSQLRCYAQSIFMQYFLWATLSWVIVISVNMIFIVKGIDSKRYELFYHAFAWTNALLWAGIPFVNNSYGPAGVWCWIKKEASILRFGVWYLPLLIVCLCLSVMYVYMFIRNRRLAKYSSAAELEQTFQIYQREVKPLLVYPFIYILLTIPIFVYRLYDVTHPHHEPKFVLLLTAVVFAPSAGFCNAVAYAFYNKSIRELSWKKFKEALVARILGKPYNVRPYEVDDARSNSVVRPIRSNSEPDDFEPKEKSEPHMAQDDKLPDESDDLKFYNSTFQKPAIRNNNKNTFRLVSNV